MKGAVLTLGALAAAVAAIIALIPKGSPIPSVSADLSGIAVEPNTTLDQYEARYAAVAAPSVTTSVYLTSRAWPQGRLVDFTTPSTDSAPTETSPASSTPTETSPASSAPTETSPTNSPPTQTSPTNSTPTETSPTSSTSTTATASPTATGAFKRAIDSFHSVSPSEIGAVAHLVITVKVPAGPEQPQDLVVTIGPTTTCGIASDDQRCAAAPQIEHELQRGVPPDVAAREVATAFANSRSEILNHELHPVGATVNYHLRLIGFQNKVATVMWSLYPERAIQPLPQEWFRSVIVMQFKADVSDDGFDGRFWMPEPKAGGRYVLDLTVVDNEGIARTSARSTPFP